MNPRWRRGKPQTVLLAVVAAVAVTVVWWGAMAVDETRGGPAIVRLADGSTQVEDSLTGQILMRIPAATVERRTAVPESYLGQLPGWPVHVATGAVEASPAVGDLDGDETLDVVVGTDQGQTYVFDAAGGIRPGWPVGNGFHVRSAALGMIGADGRTNVVVAPLSRTFLTGILDVYRHDGTSLAGWPVALASNQLVAAPTLADLDLDGRLEVLGSPAGCQYAVRWDGTLLPGWPAPLDALSAYPIRRAAVGDVDGDGSPEVFVGAQDHKLYGWNARGERLPGFPIEFPETLNGGVVLADFDGDAGLELGLTVGSGHVYLLEPDGTVLPGWPQWTGAGTNAGLAVGDLDGDGRLEVATATTNLALEDAGSVFLWGVDGQLMPGWPQRIPFFAFNATPTFADVDGDGNAELIVGGVEATFSAHGRLYIYRADASLVIGSAIFLGSGQSIFDSQVTATDLNQDGMLELLVGTAAGLSSGPGQVLALTFDAPFDPTTLHWPTEGGNFQRTGLYTPPPRKVDVSVVPPHLDLNNPPPLVAVRIVLPEDLKHLTPTFTLSGVRGRPARLEGTSVGPTAGRIRLIQFEGAALAALIRSTLDPVPPKVRLDFSADTEPPLHGFTSIEVR